MSNKNMPTEILNDIRANIENLPDKFLFQLCMGKTELIEGSLIKMFPSLRFENFDNMMKQYGNDKYNKLLFMYHREWLSWQRGLQIYITTQKDIKENDSKYKLEIAKALRTSFYLQDVTSSGFEFSIANNKEKTTVKNDRFIYALNRGILDEFEFLGLQYTSMTEEEAIESLNIEEEREWLLEHDEMFGVDDVVLDDEDNFTQYAIDTYRFFRSKRREVNSKFVESVIKELEDYITGEKKLGAKTKNLEIGNLVLRLSYLLRIDDFLNQTKISDIDRFPFSNKNCKNISDYLDFLNLTIEMYPSAKFGTPIDENGSEILDESIYESKWVGSFTNRNTTDIRSMVQKAIGRKAPNEYLLPFKKIFDDDPRERINKLWEIKHRRPLCNQINPDLSIFNMDNIFI